MDLPEFFMDKTFNYALHFNMSTSQVMNYNTMIKYEYINHEEAPFLNFPFVELLYISGVLQIASKYDLVTCFGAVVPDGYGICYNPQSNCIRFAVTAFNSNSQTDATRMGEAVLRSFDEIGMMLSKSNLQTRC